MKHQLIFLNLLIDSLWSNDLFLEKIFDVKNPETFKLARVNEYLGRYFANSGDLVVVPKLPVSSDAFIDEFIELTPVAWLEVMEPLQNVKSFSQKTIHECDGKNISETVFAGTSRLENSILEGLGLNQKTNLELVMKLNRKDYLLSLNKELDFLFPKSELVLGERISPSNDYYKNLVSSGGSGVFAFSELEMIRIWSLRKNLLNSWNQSQWLRQEVVEKKTEFNCFGHTDFNTFNAIEIKYDKNKLSYRHNFISDFNSEYFGTLKEVFEKVHLHLKSHGYNGNFGFDSIVSQSGQVFPVIDLNVRMNKSHVLDQVLRRFRKRKAHTSFFRLRFVNTHWPAFIDFWSDLNGEFALPDVLVPVDGSYWNIGKSECIVAVTSDVAADADQFESWIFPWLKKGSHHA